MARKLFISFLGTGMYEECKYYYGDEFECHEPTRYIQRATLEQIGARNWDEEDAVCIFMTDNAKQQNWNKSIHTRIGRDGKEVEYNGLETELESMNLCAKVRAVEGLPIGNTADEIWEIFDRVYREIQNGDELYIDLTHAFRYMPMLVLVLSDYAKFLKGTRLRQLSYGSFEARDKESNRAPIIDLMPLSALQNWTIAASDFMNYGVAEHLEVLSSAADERVQSFIKQLKDYTTIRKTCRGPKISGGDGNLKLRELSDEIKTTNIPPLDPIFQWVVKGLGAPKSTLDKVIDAAQWCYKNQLWQQSLSILQEGIVTAICERHGIDNRGLVNSAYNISLKMHAPKDRMKWKVANKDLRTIYRLLADDLIHHSSEGEVSLPGIFDRISVLRNNYMHAGYPDKPDIAPPEIESVIEETKKYYLPLFGTEPPKAFEFSRKLFLNISNHPSAMWSEFQISTAKNAYGQIVDVSFPQVPPEMGCDDIVKEAKRFLRKEVFAKYDNSVDLTVHVMGEMTLTYAIVSQLKSCGIRCIASCSERVSSFDPETGVKSSVFKFEGFREY